jgi:O-antigen ligase
MPVIFSLLSQSAKQRNTAQNAFLAGCIALMAVSYLIFWGIIDENRYGYSLVFHITHSFFMAVLGFWALHRSTASGSSGLNRCGWGIIALAAVINLFYIAPGRTGMFIFCCLVALFLYQRMSLARWTAGIIVCAALLAGAYYTSDNLSNRVQQAVDEISHYQKGQSRTSIGQRFDWWIVSLELIAEKPILGHGTGSYQPSHLKKTKGTRISSTDNPHNEFLFLAVQCGLAGLALFLLMIALQLQEAKNISRNNRQLLQGVILALLAGSLMNSLLFDSQQGHFYLFMSAALLAGDRQ